MKFFTFEWWSGQSGDPAEAFDAYRHFIGDFFDRLPADHQLLSRDLSLHDANLRKLSVNVEARTTDLQLDGRGFNQADKSYFGRRFVLKYSGVSKIETTADPRVGLPGPHGYGDLGYDEIEILESGIIEHRMLFSTGIELCIRHSDFAIETEDFAWD